MKIRIRKKIRSKIKTALSDFFLGSRGRGHETLHQLKDFLWK